ncbi:MAG: YdcF family protein [Sulfitobacter sp.]
MLAVTVVAITAAAASLAIKPAADFESADVIVVFGAGMSADGTLHAPSILRVERGVDLFIAGKAPKMHFTGGRAVPDGPAAGDQMAALAIELGVPNAAISRETESLSTLQNALFSMPMLKSETKAILVTEGFHLPRAAVALIWAGGPTDLQLATSTKFRGGVASSARMILREAAAWWFNSVRALGYTLGGWVGVTRDTRIGWLD